MYDILGDSDDAKCLDRRAARLRVEEREKEGERGEEEEREGEGRAVGVVGGASVADVRAKAVDTQREDNQHGRVKGARRKANANRVEPELAAADMWRNGMGDQESKASKAKQAKLSSIRRSLLLVRLLVSGLAVLDVPEVPGKLLMPLLAYESRLPPGCAFFLSLSVFPPVNASAVILVPYQGSESDTVGSHFLRFTVDPSWDASVL